MLRDLRDSTASRLALIGATLAGLLLALVLSVSGELHERLHHDDGDHHHECLATVLHSGACDSSTPAPVLEGIETVLIETARRDFFRIVESPFLSCRILEHAPPAVS